MTTIDGIRYDFQSAGEFVSLRGDGLEIQTRQTAIATTFNPGANSYTGLATCVSLNTAVAALVGTHRVSYQPNISGVPDPSGLQLRVDGALTTLGAQGLDLGSGGRIVKSGVGGGIEIDFPNGTTLIVTPGWWTSQSKWYLNVNAYHSPATEGTMGALARGSWLPALRDGTSLGPRPASLHHRCIALNETFADSWRVTDATSLFDYAPGTSTTTFTIDSWPKESPPCVLPQEPSAKPLKPEVAELQCRGIVDKNRKADCVFDVTVTGEPGFAKTYLLTQQLEAGATTTTVTDDKDPTQVGELVTFTATATRKASSGSAPTGTVQFSLDGAKVGAPIGLDSNGRGRWKTSSLEVGSHQVAASFIPSKGSVFLPSCSLDEAHTVGETSQAAGACTKLAFRTAVGAVSIPVGQSVLLGTVDIGSFRQIRVVADERVGSATDVRIRLTITEGNELVAQLDVLNLTPHSQVTKVIRRPGYKIDDLWRRVGLRDRLRCCRPPSLRDRVLLPQSYPEQIRGLRLTNGPAKRMRQVTRIRFPTRFSTSSLCSLGRAFPSFPCTDTRKEIRNEKDDGNKQATCLCETRPDSSRKRIEC